jgi:hypothetical protein
VSRRGPLVAALIGLAVSLLVIFALILPKISSVNSTNKAVDEARSEQSVLQGKLAQLKDTAARAEEFRKRLQVLEAEVPPTTDLPGLIRLLNDAADHSAVDFMSIAPAQPTIAVPGSAAAPATLPSPGASPGTTGTTGTLGGTASVSVIPVTITVEGSFFAVDEYLFRLETLPRASKVMTIALTVGTGGLPQLSLTLTVNFFTSDTSAGPGSQPGSQDSGQASTGTVGPTPTPSVNPSFGVSPSPTSSPTG